MYRKAIIGLVSIALWSTMSCGGNKRDAAYYMDMVDSIRKAEQVKEIHRKAGIYQNPVDAWFDTLNIRTLPIRTAGRDIWQIGSFAAVPSSINENFGYPVSAKLKALALPTAFRHPVVMLAEMVDSLTPKLYVYTMDKRHQPLDYLAIYEFKPLDYDGDYGTTYQEYYITSKYEITILVYFQSHNQLLEPELINSRRYIINKEGRFQKIKIELGDEKE